MQVVKSKVGVVLLLWQADYPTVEDLPKDKGTLRIARFYNRMMQETEAFCQRLSDAAAAAYEADQNPRKRFCFSPYQLTVTAQMTHTDGRFLIVERQARLTRKGQEPILRQTCDIFHLPTGYLCSPLAYRLFRV